MISKMSYLIFLYFGAEIFFRSFGVQMMGEKIIFGSCSLRLIGFILGVRGILNLRGFVMLLCEFRIYYLSLFCYLPPTIANMTVNYSAILNFQQSYTDYSNFQILVKDCQKSMSVNTNFQPAPTS